MTQPWNAARAASKRPLRKPYKPRGPVGPSPEQLAELKWTKALDMTRKAMAANPDFDAVICSPQDADRLKVLGLRVISHVYARKGEWSLYTTPKEAPPDNSLAARTQRYEAQLSCTRPTDEPGEGP